MNSTTALAATTLHDAIMQASDCLNSLYPISNFIACNALKGWEEIPFPEAMRKSATLFGSKGFLELAEYRAMYESGRIAPADLEEAFQKNKALSEIRPNNTPATLTMAELFDRNSSSQLVEVINKQMMKWCAAYLDGTQAQWKVKNKQEESLYSFWKALAPHDHSMSCHGIKNWSRSVKALAENSQDALAELLDELDVQAENITPYLRRHFAQMPGYASHLKWRQTDNGEANILTDYLAIRLHYEKMLAEKNASRRYKSTDLAQVRLILETATRQTQSIGSDDQPDYSAVWQEAYELNYRNRLLASLNAEAKPTVDNACCQLVFCIDVRSEPIRRRLEEIGPYSTYGFAGFFGMAMRLTELGSALSVDLCPVLLKPNKAVDETSNDRNATKKINWQALKVSALQLKKQLKCNLAGAFGLVELAGLCSALPLMARTFMPVRANKLQQFIESKIAGHVESSLDLSSFSLSDKIALAEGAIRGIGLSHMSKVVVLCGHRSTSANNPFASALDCGACGGNGGSFSARLAAKILNDREVRAGLLSKRIHIPSSTVFIAAEHDTTTDQFTFYDVVTLSDDQENILSRLKEDLVIAGDSLRKARAKSLPASSMKPFNDPLNRACDWAQIAPEWGLAGNAAFIAAPRNLSQESDLDGRVFLHSYDYKQDEQGKVLELIMTAPLVVAQWINMQYYLSTVDNDKFGSGSKVVHNVVGDFGVMQGGQGDLRMGLPLQSLMTAEARVHEPMRLLAVIRAPLTAIDEVLDKHPEVRKLVVNRWIRLVGLDPESATFYEAEDSGKWNKIHYTSQTEGLTDTGNGAGNVGFTIDQTAMPLRRQEYCPRNEA